MIDIVGQVFHALEFDFVTRTFFHRLDFFKSRKIVCDRFSEKRNVRYEAGRHHTYPGIEHGLPRLTIFLRKSDSLTRLRSLSSPGHLPRRDRRHE